MNFLTITYLTGDPPFITHINGNFCLHVLESIEKQESDDTERYDKGEGDYTFSARFCRGQYDECGREELAPYWDLEFISFVSSSEECNEDPVS